MEPGGWFDVKMPPYQYNKSICGDKTILRPSYLHSGISYTEKMTFYIESKPCDPFTNMDTLQSQHG